MTRCFAVEKVSTLYSPECASLISKLPPEIKRLVRSTVEALLTTPAIGTELTGELEGYRSHRIRRYRIIYRINQKECCVEIYHVGHRSDVYEALRSLLLGRN